MAKNNALVKRIQEEVASVDQKGTPFFELVDGLSPMQQWERIRMLLMTMGDVSARMRNLQVFAFGKVLDLMLTAPDSLWDADVAGRPAPSSPQSLAREVGVSPDTVIRGKVMSDHYTLDEMREFADLPNNVLMEATCLDRKLRNPELARIQKAKDSGGLEPGEGVSKLQELAETIRGVSDASGAPEPDGKKKKKEKEKKVSLPKLQKLAQKACSDTTMLAKNVENGMYLPEEEECISIRGIRDSFDEAITNLDHALEKVAEQKGKKKK